MIDFKISHPLKELGVSHVDQFFGPWAIEESHFRKLLSVVSGTDLKSHIELNAEKPLATGAGFETISPGIAYFEISGPMSKRGSSFNRGGGTIRVRNEIRQARQAGIKTMVLKIESPGGTVAGTKELGDDIAAAVADGVRFVGFADDLAASAAYWALSQCSEAYANEPALVGSIGTFLILDDYSKLFEKAGVTVHVIKAGEMKAAGSMGTEVTEEQIAYFQELINQTNELFLAAVKTGREFRDEELAAVANGKVYTAADAANLGLIDGVRTFDEVVNALVSGTDSEGSNMKTSLLKTSKLDKSKAENDVNKTSAKDETSPDDTAAEDTPEETAEDSPSDYAAAEDTPEETAEDSPSDDAAAKASINAQLERFSKVFGDAKAFEYVRQGKTYAEALEDFVSHQKQTYEAEIKSLKSQLKVAKSAEPGDISSGGADDGDKNSRNGFAAGMKRIQAGKN